MIKKFFSLVLIFLFTFQMAHAGLLVSRSNGISLTGADGVQFVGLNGISLTGADGFLSYRSNGISLTGADGISLTGADGISLTGADGAAYTGANGISLTGADGISLTGADGISLTGADGISLTGADGVVYQADSVIIRKSNGISLTGADGISLTGADGISLTGADGISLTGADGISLTGADGISLTGADGISLTGADGISLTGADTIVSFRKDGATFTLTQPSGISLTGADGISLTGADGVTIVNPRGISLTGADMVKQFTTGTSEGLQSIDPELALLLNNSTDDSNINAVIVFHNYPTQTDLAKLQQMGISGGTLFRALPMIYVTTTRSKLIAVSHLKQVRSIYGNRTLNFDADPYFKKTGIQRVATDRDLQQHNAGTPVTGRNVTVAVLDTGVNSQHGDLTGRVVQNVRLVDTQSAAIGFLNPMPVENVVNTDPASGHGTFVAGVVAASGQMSGGKYNGVAPGAKILGLSAGDANLTHVLAGFDYLLEKGANYNVRVVNCSFSAAAHFDYHDPVNIATEILTKRGVNVVFSAGNGGSGTGTLNPYSVAPWVIGVGASDEKGKLASFSSRGAFGNSLQRPTVVAPGVNVIGLRNLVSQTGVLGVAGADTNRLSLTEIPYYTTASGTSFSAPQVAGAIALMLEANPNLTPEQIKDILSRTATPLTGYYAHETGAGMLNTHAAVLEAAFPNRRTGFFRAELDRSAVNFTTAITQVFSGTVVPGNSATVDVSVPQNSLQVGVHISWGLSGNDFGLKLFDGKGNLRGESNYLNLPGITGSREKVTLNKPAGGTYQAAVKHTTGIGTTQVFHGVVETTKVEVTPLVDVNDLPLQSQAVIYESLQSFLMLPQGTRFRPDAKVTREELAETLVRGGYAPQFVAAAPLFLDVKNLTSRNAIEAVQSRPEGKLIYDANIGSAFQPNASASKLVTAVALVKAAELDSLAAVSILPASVLDAASIPTQYRGYVAVALQKGFISLDGNYFNPTRALTRLELAYGIVNLSRLTPQ
ncbi:MAG TPA: S8 family serine peptidase [Pyrinomonadaceae bacterium]|nr:S8 family serine peptidase [Pyrinomonadaceae bacterium]